jgi:CHASE3 domain sensor protein
MKSVVRWLRAALGTTPGRYRLWSIGLGLLLAATGVACLVAVTAIDASSRRISTNNGPVLVASQRLVASLAEADAAATASFLAGGEGDREQLRLYDEALARASVQLEEIAALVGDEPEIHEIVQDVSVDVTRYAGLIEAARAHNRAGIPGGDAYLVEAIDLLAGDINGDVARLSDAVEVELEAERANLTEDVYLPIGLATISLVLLLVAQAYVVLRSHRLLSPLLALATVILVAAMAWLGLSVNRAADAIADASDDGYRSIALTADIQTSASRSKSAEMVALITGDPSRRDAASAAAADLSADPIAPSTVDGVREGASAGTGLLFEAGGQADSARERAAVAETMTWWQRYVDAVTELRAADPVTAIAIAVNQANPLFNGFNFTVESVLGDNEVQFIDGLDDASGSLGWLALGTLALALLAALLVLLGFQSRINEYD